MLADKEIVLHFLSLPFPPFPLFILFVLSRGNLFNNIFVPSQFHILSLKLFFGCTVKDVVTSIFNPSQLNVCGSTSSFQVKPHPDFVIKSRDNEHAGSTTTTTTTYHYVKDVHSRSHFIVCSKADKKDEA